MCVHVNASFKACRCSESLIYPTCVQGVRHKVKITPRHDRDGNDPFHLHEFTLQTSRGIPFVLLKLPTVALTPMNYSIHNIYIIFLGLNIT